MSSVHHIDASPLAFDLLARLETYEADLELVAQGRVDAARYRLLNRQLAGMGACTGALPQLAASIMDITLVHSQLMQALWGRASDGIAHLMRRQRAALHALRERCLALIGRARVSRHAAKG